MNCFNNSSAARQLGSETAQQLLNSKQQKNKSKNLSFFSLVFAGMFFFSGMGNCATVIKFATLAPEGTSWLKTMREFFKDVSAKRKTELNLKSIPAA